MPRWRRWEVDMVAVVDGCRGVLTGGAGQGAHREVGLKV